MECLPTENDSHRGFRITGSMLQRRCAEERGAYLVEFALVFPLALLLVFGVLDIARIGVGYSTVRSAAAEGARYGPSFGLRESSGITNLFTDAASSAHVAPINLVAGYAESKDLRTFISEGKNADWYLCKAKRTGYEALCDNDGYARMRNMYRIELRAMAAANIVMMRNVSDAKWPCDANYPAAVGGTGEPGCFRCFTQRGESNFRAQHIIGTAANERWRATALKITCEYDVPISSTSVFLGVLPRHVTVRGEATQIIDDYRTVMYRPALQ